MIDFQTVIGRSHARGIDLDWVSDSGLRSFLNGCWILVLAKLDGRDVGASGLGGQYNEVGIFVREGFQGLGIGSALLKETVVSVSPYKIAFLSGTVHADNYRSIGLMRKHGYQTIFEVEHKGHRDEFVLTPLTPYGRLLSNFLNLTPYRRVLPALYRNSPTLFFLPFRLTTKLGQKQIRSLR